MARLVSSLYDLSFHEVYYRLMRTLQNSVACKDLQAAMLRTAMSVRGRLQQYHPRSLSPKISHHN